MQAPPTTFQGYGFRQTHAHRNQSYCRWKSLIVSSEMVFCNSSVFSTNTSVTWVDNLGEALCCRTDTTSGSFLWQSALEFLHKTDRLVLILALLSWQRNVSCLKFRGTFREALQVVYSPSLYHKSLTVKINVPVGWVVVSLQNQSEVWVSSDWRNLEDLILVEPRL